MQLLDKKAEFVNYRSYKNPDFIYKLTNKELADYYNCYRHHLHFKSRCVCKDGDGRLIANSSTCPTCFFQSATSSPHYCTKSGKISSSVGCNEASVRHPERKCECGSNESYHYFRCKNDSTSFTLCENYRPSFTSKEHQIEETKRKIYNMRKSKSMLKKTLKDLDNLIEKKEDDSGLNEVERFYRTSNKFIGSSMQVTSLCNYLPRCDIKPRKHDIGYKKFDPNMEQELIELYGNAVFGLRNAGTFTDSELAEKLGKLKPKKIYKAENPLKRAKSVNDIIFCKEK